MTWIRMQSVAMYYHFEIRGFQMQRWCFIFMVKFFVRFFFDYIKFNWWGKSVHLLAVGTTPVNIYIVFSLPFDDFVCDVQLAPHAFWYQWIEAKRRDIGFCSQYMGFERVSHSNKAKWSKTAKKKLLSGKLSRVKLQLCVIYIVYNSLS